MIGFDAECFLDISGKSCCAENFIGGSKYSPILLGSGIVGHSNNVMVNFSAAKPFDPCKILAVVNRGISVLSNAVYPAKVVIEPSRTFDKKVLKKSTLAGEVGCDPDYQHGRIRPPITAGDLGNTRFAGGHLHFDTDPDIPPYVAASVCDVLLGAPCVAMGEKQGNRRAAYGLDGLYRPKPYGIEYRTLSNFWLNLIRESSENSAKFIELVEMTAKILKEADFDTVCHIISLQSYAADIINNENHSEAVPFLASLKVDRLMLLKSTVCY